MGTTTGNSPLVMVSSVVDGFGEFREAARLGILAACGRGLLVNEDFPSIAASSRNVCLDAVGAADAYVVIVGARGGWRTPSGKLVVEEEFEEAVRLKKPVFVYLQEGVERDADGTRFAARLSDYVSGYFRTTFSSSADLREKVATSISNAFPSLSPTPMTSPAITAVMAARPKIQRGPSLRFVLAPTTKGELVDPADIETREFAQRTLEIAHSAAVGLLDFRNSTTSAVKGDSLILTSGENRGELSSFEIHESGLVAIDISVERERNQSDFGIGMVVAEEDIEARLAATFRFCGELYAWKDPFGRNQQFAFNCAILELGYHTIEREPKLRSSYGVSMRGNGPVIAYEPARTVSLHDLAEPGDEVRRALVKLNRAAKSET